MPNLEAPQAEYQVPSIEELRERIDDEQKDAALQAETIGEFKRVFLERTLDLFENAGNDGTESDDYLAPESRAQLRRLVLGRKEAIESTVNGKEGTRLGNMEADALGENRIGAGKEGMRLNRLTFAHLRKKEKGRLDHTVAHEIAHGDQVALHGRINGLKEQPDSILVYEGHAQVRAEEETGVDGSEQPDVIYGEGERLVRELIRRNSRHDVERVLTETGDLSELNFVIQEDEEAEEWMKHYSDN